MALTRRMLTAMGIEPEKIDEIITAHAETVDALKAERDKYKEDASKLPDVQKELDDYKANSGDGKMTYKEKYEKEHAAYENYKTEQKVKETRAKKTAAYKDLLKQAGISEKHINTVLRASDVSGLEFDTDGKVKDADKAIEGIKNDWSDLIVNTQAHGAHTPTPPNNDGGSGVSADAAYARARFAQNYSAMHGNLPGSQNSNTNDGGEK